MKKVFGLLLIIAGIIAGLYVCGWLLFIKPIIALCVAIDAGCVTAVLVGTTLLKIVFASVVGGLIFCICSVGGTFIID